MTQKRNFLLIIAAVALALSGSPVAVAHQGDHNHRQHAVAYPLLHSAFHQNYAEVKRLLDGGANPNIANGIGWTALTVAAYQGNIRFVKMLLAAGANPNTFDTTGISVLEVAATYGHYAIVGVLIEAGAKY